MFAPCCVSGLAEFAKFSSFLWSIFYFVSCFRICVFLFQKLCHCVWRLKVSTKIHLCTDHEHNCTTSPSKLKMQGERFPFALKIIFSFIHSGKKSQLQTRHKFYQGIEEPCAASVSNHHRAQRVCLNLSHRSLRSNSQRWSCCRMLPMTDTPGHAPSCTPMHFTPGAASTT